MAAVGKLSPQKRHDLFPVVDSRHIHEASYYYTDVVSQQ